MLQLVQHFICFISSKRLIDIPHLTYSFINSQIFMLVLLIDNYNIEYNSSQSVSVFVLNVAFVIISYIPMSRILAHVVILH